MVGASALVAIPNGIDVDPVHDAAFLQILDALINDRLQIGPFPQAAIEVDVIDAW